MVQRAGRRVGGRPVADRDVRWGGCAPGGSTIDFHFDLSRDGHVGACVWHAHLGPEEIQLYYDLAVAGKMVVCNPQARGALYAVCGRTYGLDEIPGGDPADVAFVDSAEELASYLRGDHERFLDYRRHITGN